MLSVIIPTLNEADLLEAMIGHLRRARGCEPVEIIVSDCHSRDGTAESAGRLGTRLVPGGANRADAMNRGAAAARGDVLLFLHADSLPPEGFLRIIRRALRDRRIVGGAFDFEFAPDPRHAGPNRLKLDWIVLCNRARFRMSGNFFGDQGIFVRREVFKRIGGFPRCDLMEDVRFCRQMQHFGRAAILRPPMLTSPRRFLTRGVVRQFLQDLWLLTCDSMGCAPSRSFEQYNAWNQSNACTAPHVPERKMQPRPQGRGKDRVEPVRAGPGRLTPSRRGTRRTLGTTQVTR